MGEKGFGGHLRIGVLEASYLNPSFCRVYYWGALETRGERRLVCVNRCGRGPDLCKSLRERAGCV